MTQTDIGDVAAPVEKKEEKREEKKKSKTKFDIVPYLAMSLFSSISCTWDVVDFGRYCDPSWYQDWHTPYYNDSHRKFRDAVREFVDKEIMPYHQ